MDLRVINDLAQSQRLAQIPILQLHGVAKQRPVAADSYSGRPAAPLLFEAFGVVAVHVVGNVECVYQKLRLTVTRAHTVYQAEDMRNK
ncbi:MAG: hypothetical protein ACI9UQ_001919 [Candidatus Krumholzibacteriia bacterium]|jgi:hypothetical protein